MAHTRQSGHWDRVQMKLPVQMGRCPSRHLRRRILDHHRYNYRILDHHQQRTATTLDIQLTIIILGRHGSGVGFSVRKSREMRWPTVAMSVTKLWTF